MLMTVERGYKVIKSCKLYGDVSVNIDKFVNGPYVISLTDGMEIFKEIDAGTNRDMALKMFKIVGVVAALKQIKQAKPTEQPQPTATVTVDTKRVGFPRTEKVGNRAVVKKDENGKPEWCITNKMRGVIEAVQGAFKTVFTASRVAYDYQDDYGVRQIGNSISWRETTCKFEEELTEKMVGDELVFVSGASKWRRMASKPIGTQHLGAELLRLTCGTEDDVIALIEQATVGV